MFEGDVRDSSYLERRGRGDGENEWEGETKERKEGVCDQGDQDVNQNKKINGKIKILVFVRVSTALKRHHDHSTSCL